MARDKKKSRDAGGGYNWMDTYGDMVTLLLTFFIMLFSMSTVNEEKWEILVKAFARDVNAVSAQVVLVPEGDGDDVAPEHGMDSLEIGEEAIDDNLPIDLSQLYEYLKKYIEENNMSDSITIEKDVANNVYVRFDNNIFFDGDSSRLRQEGYPILDFMGDCLKNVEDEIFMVRVNGHTAAIPGVDDYKVSDWMLSAERASQVVIYFEEQKGLDPKKLMSNGYGKNYPRESNDTPEGRAKNRRVEIMILGNDFNTGNAEDLYAILTRLMSAEIIEDAANASDIIRPSELENGPQENEDASQAQQDALPDQDQAQQAPAGDNASSQSQPVMPQ